MEVVGAVASFIAIGQVLVAGRHVIDVLRAIPGIGDELAWLNNEIETLRLVVEEADMRGTSTDQSLPETPLLRRARLQLSEVVADLEGIHRDCVRVAGEDGKFKAKKRKWFFQQKRLSECREKARDARGNILAALQTLQLKETRETKKHVLSIQSFTIETHASMALMSSSSKGFYESSHHLHRPRHAKSIDRLTPELEQFVLSENRPTKASKPILGASDSITINASLSTFGKCSEPCGCRCQTSRPASYRSADWARTLIGSVSLNYKQQLNYGSGAKCNSKTCKGSGKASAHFSYCFPAWLCSRLISFQASWGASGEISVSLRPARVLSTNDTFWGCVKTGTRRELRQLMHHQGIIYPGDVDSHGLTALQYVIQIGTTDIVTYLTDFWGQQLNSGSFDDSWFFHANRLIEDGYFLASEKQDSLRSLISRSEGRVDAQETLLHSAIRQADFGKMQQAAKSQPWSMSQLNHRGETPLHLAASLGNVDVVKKLLRLGCDVDQKDGNGDTVLMRACAMGHTLMAQFLLDAGCIVDAKNNRGFTALHCATMLTDRSLTEIISSLLSAGASTTITNSNGRSVLHSLMWSDSDKETFGVALRMLLNAGANLEAQGYMGKTPLVTAIEWNRLVALQCFVEAGASTSKFGSWGNILHLAALAAGYEVLSYLESLSLSGLNLYFLSQEGNTAWDCFIWVSYIEDWRIAGRRRPSSDEKEAFVRLYQGVRDKNLNFDINMLQRVRQYALDEHERGATAALAPLIKQKEEWKRGDLVETYKTIRLQVREAMWDAAIESVEENVEILQGQMAKSPWENYSYWNYLFHQGSDVIISESEDESKTTTVHSAKTEDQAMEIEKNKEEK